MLKVMAGHQSLNLNLLPESLVRVLDTYCECDEAKSRAVLAPWIDMECFRIIDNLSIWESSLFSLVDKSSIRKMLERNLREYSHILKPDVPYFPVGEQSNIKTIVSKYPLVLSDAQYWAFVMQFADGCEDTFSSVMESPKPYLNGMNRVQWLASKKSSFSIFRVLGLTSDTSVFHEFWQDLVFERSGNYL